MLRAQAPTHPPSHTLTNPSPAPPFPLPLPRIGSESNCGDATTKVCTAYGIFSGQCSIAGQGGGGTECGNTYVCCIITKPAIKPDANGVCHAI